MGTGRTLLILLLLCLPIAASAAESCGTCHTPHYVEHGGCTHCHRGDPRTDRLELAHANLIGARFAWFALPDNPLTQAGSRLLDAAGCRRCHRSDGRGNLLASDLDRLLPEARPEETLQAIRQPVLFMPDFGFAEATAVSLVNALFAHSARAERSPGEAPMVVHFEGVARVENPFEKHCGGCHQLLTAAWGGLGQGSVGPNLSGLFSEFYPRTFRDDERWSPANLEKWLKNPRAIRAAARMAPQRLPPDELPRLLPYFELPEPPADSAASSRVDAETMTR